MTPLVGCRGGLPELVWLSLRRWFWLGFGGELTPPAAVVAVAGGGEERFVELVGEGELFAEVGFGISAVSFADEVAVEGAFERDLDAFGGAEHGEAVFFVGGEELDLAGGGIAGGDDAGLAAGEMVEEDGDAGAGRLRGKGGFEAFEDELEAVVDLGVVVGFGIAKEGEDARAQIDQLGAGGFAILEIVSAELGDEFCDSGFCRVVDGGSGGGNGERCKENEEQASHEGK